MKKHSILCLLSIAMLFGTAQIANATNNKSGEATGMIVTLFDGSISSSSGDVKHKAFINFFQLDDDNKLQLVDKLRFRENILLPAKGIDFNKPVVINYYVEVENKKINGDCHTIMAKDAKNCELKVMVKNGTTSLKIAKIGAGDDPRLVKGICFKPLDN